MKPLLLIIAIITVAIVGSNLLVTASAQNDTPFRITTSQNALSTTAELIVPRDTTARKVKIENLDAAINIFVGPAGVTAANGKRIKPGVVHETNTLSEIYAVAASGTPSHDVWIEK